MVNATTGQKSGVLIELPNGPRNNAASGGEEAGDLDDEMEEERDVSEKKCFCFCIVGKVDQFHRPFFITEL